MFLCALWYFHLFPCIFMYVLMYLCSFLFCVSSFFWCFSFFYLGVFLCSNLFLLHLWSLILSHVSFLIHAFLLFLFSHAPLCFLMFSYVSSGSSGCSYFLHLICPCILSCPISFLSLSTVSIHDMCSFTYVFVPLCSHYFYCSASSLNKVMLIDDFMIIFYFWLILCVWFAIYCCYYYYNFEF